MATKKKLRVKEIKIRVTDELYLAFDKYVKNQEVTKTKVIEDFLRDLLKDDLE